MPYYLSYIMFHDKVGIDDSFFALKKGSSPLGHCSIAITEIKAGESPKILFRIGLFGSGQVLLEDFSIKKENRSFFHKTYPISQEELTSLLVRVNNDRREIMNIKKDKVKHDVGKEGASTPGGPEFNWFSNNCKSYAQSLLREVGIDDPSIANILTDVVHVPLFSGDLVPLEFQNIEGSNVLEWVSPFVVTPRSNYDSFSEEEMTQLEEDSGSFSTLQNDI